MQYKVNVGWDEVKKKSRKIYRGATIMNRVVRTIYRVVRTVTFVW